MGPSFRWGDGSEYLRLSIHLCDPTHEIGLFPFICRQEPSRVRFVDALTRQDAAGGVDEEMTMKTMFLTIALAMSTAAIAQPPTDAPPPADQVAAQPDTAMPAAAPMPQGKIVMPSQSVEQAFPPPPPKADYPWCSRTLTDACKQRRDPGYNK
jgi:hypothetical protein